MAIKQVKITEGQTLFDIALQYYGDVSKAIDIIKLNDNIPSLLFNGLNGLTINVDEQNNDVVNYYKTNNIKITTRFPEITGGNGFSTGFSNGFN